MTETAPSYVARDLTAPPGGTVRTVRQCDVIACLEASHPYQIQIDGSPATQIEAGISLRLMEPATQIRVINPREDVPLHVRLGLSRGDVRDSRTVVPDGVGVRLVEPAMIAQPVEIEAPEPLPVQTPPVASELETYLPRSIPDGRDYVVLLAQPQRLEIGLCNLGPGVAWVHADDGSTGRRGAALAVGQTIVLATTAAIRAYADGGHVELSRWELNR